MRTKKSLFLVFIAISLILLCFYVYYTAEKSISIKGRIVYYAKSSSIVRIYNMIERKAYNLTYVNAGISAFGISKDLGDIYFLSGGNNIMRLSRNSGKIDKIFNIGFRVVDVSLSIDDKYLVFNSDPLKSNQYISDLYTLNINSNEKALVYRDDTIHDSFMNGSLSPDSKYLVFMCRSRDSWEICISEKDGRNLRQLTSNVCRDSSPVWSPDGRYIAFISDRTGFEEIYTMDIYGGKVVKITDDERDKTNPAWSPDGEWIAFIGEHNIYGLPYLWVVDKHGNHRTVLSQTDQSNTEVVWLP